MTVGGWLFMGGAWLIVGGLTAYCFGRLLFGDGRRK